MAARFQQQKGISPYDPEVLIGGGAALMVIPSLIVALRFLTRYWYRIAHGWDDWTILAALFLCFGSGIVMIVAAALGGAGEHQKLGVHGELIHYPGITIFQKCLYVSEIISTADLAVVKVSILLFYRRLFTIRVFKIADTIMIVLVIAWGIALTTVLIGQCTPVSTVWNNFEFQNLSHCIHSWTVYKAMIWSDLSLDIVVLIFPIPMITALHMPWRKKFEITQMFMLGTIVIGSGVVRVITFMLFIDFGDKNPEAYSHDATWYGGGWLFWAFAENSIAIIGACLPTLAPLWKRYNHHTSSRSTSDQRSDPSRDSTCAGGICLDSRDSRGLVDIQPGDEADISRPSTTTSMSESSVVHHP